jgi:hypothetical protein
MVAAAFFRLHDYIEKNEYKQSQPRQFIALLKSESEGNEGPQTALH